MARATTSFSLRLWLTTAFIAIGSLAVFGAFASGQAAAYSSKAYEFQDQTGSVNCGLTNLRQFGSKEALICNDTKGFLRLRGTGTVALVKWHEPFSPLGGQPPVTLKPGAKWSWRSIRCVLAAASVTCTNAQKHGFTATGKTYKSF
jgi:hypothetical protein